MELLTDLRTRPGPNRPTVVAIGNFDGVHLGHQHLLNALKEMAKEKSARSAVLVFDPHPRAFFGLKAPFLSVTTGLERREILSGLGVDLLIEQAFDAGFSSLSYKDFLNRILKEKLSVSGVVVGEDFSFGKGREGNATNLSQWGKENGIEIRVASDFKLSQNKISSSLVREYLLEGKIKEANGILGRPFFYEGDVQPGDSRGTRIGFPTANLSPPLGKIVVPFGVYATKLYWRGQIFPSVTNVGVRPTFTPGETKPRIETHAWNERVDCRGYRIKIELIARLREERRFSGVTGLVEQIGHDIEDARRILSG